ncbi:MAG TPA: CDGSH iron-sulfur domain-containing protein [Solirubrobacteraceae bacterium]|jgi:CDGSH-type Zn-finger protein/truncated hemoglobin YjbI|nr:CDGSH iron-sulfur domain-containing protein [Solirubrobacteraceae bacterium]
MVVESAAQLRAAIVTLLDRALELESAAVRGLVPADTDSGEQQDDLAFVAQRLRRSVIRPLADAAPGEPERKAQATEEDRGGLGERLAQLARDATTLRLSPGVPAEVQEATAALQDLACRFAPGDSQLVDGLREMQAELPAAIQSERNGPYLVTNANHLADWLGTPLPTLPQMALCRCGGSKTKPFCDGTHAEIGFTDEKDPNRVADRRDTYRGQQLTILDNRGICQHSGYCTDRLATVFRVDQEPFVAPSGGRMDEIIRAVRSCPSGALSYALDGVEERADVDHHDTRVPSIEVSKDGPYRITGGIGLLGPEGEGQEQGTGASTEHYALCRCGQSQNKPFCSGMHWHVDFKDPVGDPDREPTIFEWAGGYPALLRMTRMFYEKHVPQDPLLAPLFANMSPDHPERVAKWLGEVFGGPQAYSEQHGGYPRMLSQHIGKGLTEEKRARWVQLIMRSAKEAGLPADPEFRSAFSSYIEWGSRLALENSQPGAKPPESMPMPHWGWNTAAGPPGSRISALQPTGEDDRPAVLPHPDEPVSFEKHVKTLFRHRDRQSMTFAFDLWSYEDVKQNAQPILERLHNGSMPCDGGWQKDKVDAFERWVTTGMRE